MKRFFAGLIILLSLTATGAVYNLENIPNPKVADSRTSVSNPDGIIRAETVYELNILLDSLEKTTRTEVAVVLVESIGDENIEMFATSLFKNWGIGKAKEDNGLLVLFVLDQRAIRFETGYGIEGLMPDAMASRIQQQSMFPYFKSGDYDTGFLKGMQHVVSVLKQENFEAEKKTIAWGVVLPVVAAIYLIIMLISFVWIGASVKKISNNPTLKTSMSQYKALKSEKTGILVVLNILIPAISLFVIIMFADPRLLVFLIGVPIVTIPANLYGKLMMRKIRRKPIPCNACEGTMHILSERKEDAHLKLSQQFEEELNAVDYDVFVCDDCGNEAIFTLDKPSVYTECPKCGTKAFILHDKRVVVAPTFINGGTERTTYKCKFCGYEENNNTHLPRLSRSGSLAAGAAAGSIFSGRGGFGSGGFGGGSFGGGLSGGGGATGRW
jgi:uncharacterized protein